MATPTRPGTRTRQPQPTIPPEDKPTQTPPAPPAPPVETAVEACPGTYPRKNNKGVESQMKCGKPKGHEGDHGPKPAEKLDFSKVTPDRLTAAVYVLPDDLEITLREEERSQAQKDMDGWVKRAYDAWVIMGKPKEFDKSNKQGFMCADRNEWKIFKAMLDKSAKFLKLRVRTAPYQTDPNTGQPILVWIACDRVPRAKKTDGGAPATEASKTGS